VDEGIVICKLGVIINYRIISPKIKNMKIQQLFTKLRESKNTLLKKSWLALIFLLLVCSPRSFAGPITITPEVLPNGNTFANYSHTFTATGDLVGVVWKLRLGDVLPAGLAFDPATHSILPATPATAGQSIVFRLQVVNDAGDFDEETFQLTIDRLPIDLMLVLDKSGSMGYSFDGTNFSAPIGQRRWDGLVTGVSAMAEGIKALTLLPNDRLGIRYFESTPNPVFVPTGAPFNGGLVPMTIANLDLAKAEVASRGPGSGTALGNGIIAGKGILLPGTPNNRKAMIVFSDGVQNAGDMVSEVTMGAIQAYRHTLSGADLNGTDQFTIHTICLGSGGDNPTLMENIAINNGSGHYSNSMVGDLPDFMTNTFISTMQNILNGSSPQYVDVRSGRFANDSASTRFTATESFVVNRFVNSVFVVLGAENKNEPFFKSVVKDGVELVQFIQQSSGPGYRTFTIKFPIPGMPALKPEGQWKVTAMLGSRPPVAPPYTLSLTVDDHLNKITYTAANRNLKVGDVLTPIVTFERNTLPVQDASVQAFIFKPGDDINDLLARSNVKAESNPSDPSTPDVGKLAELLKDSAFVAKMKALNRVVTMNYDAATKKYTGNFSELDVVGVYRAIFRIIENDSTFGSVNRYEEQNFNVRFKDIDLPNSNLVVSVDANGNSVITCRFISSTGKFIGPGWASVINLDSSSAGLKIDNIEDLGDGTYKIHFNGKLSGTGKLTLLDETVYNGDLSNIGKAGGGGFNLSDLWKQWWFWLLLLILILIIVRLLKKKGP
jgi:hypothetical protein